MSRYCPRFLGVQGIRQRRQEYFPISGSSRASAQLAPPSVDTSTRRIPYPESKATPSISVCIPGCKISLRSGRTNMERTLNLLIGTVSLAKSFGDSVPFGALGMRYALSVQKLLKSWEYRDVAESMHSIWSL